MNRIYDTPDASSWWALPWVDFALMPDRPEALVVLPLHGLVDRGPGIPLDAEERLGARLLTIALGKVPGSVRVIVAPPVRWVTGEGVGAMFGLPYPLAVDHLAEVVRGIARSGFRRVALFNTSALNEDFADASARDLRVELGLSMFVINLAGLSVQVGREPLDGPEVDHAGERLAGLLREVLARPLLADGGRIPDADPLPWLAPAERRAFGGGAR